jgi:biotin synthase-like enzyme
MNAPQIQRQEMRRAFYAGASALFTIMTTQMTEGDEPQEADMNMMDDIHQELNDFSDAIGAGRA